MAMLFAFPGRTHCGVRGKILHAYLFRLAVMTILYYNMEVPIHFMSFDSLSDAGPDLFFLHGREESVAVITQRPDTRKYYEKSAEIRIPDYGREYAAAAL